MDLGTISEELRPIVTARVARYCGDRDLAEESTQEALARAVAHWGDAELPERLEGWLVRVAMNLVHDHHRRLAVGRRYAPMIAAAPIMDIPDVHDGIVLRDLLGRLSPRQRTVILLRFVAGCSVAETAMALGCPTGTVKSLTHRGVALLREGLRRAS